MGVLGAELRPVRQAEVGQALVTDGGPEAVDVASRCLGAEVRRA